MLQNSKKTEETVKALEKKLKDLKEDAKRLGSKISKKTLNENSDWLVKEYGIDRYLELLSYAR